MTNPRPFYFGSTHLSSLSYNIIYRTELSQATGLFLKAQGSGARLFSLLDRKQPSLVPLQDGTTDMPIARTLPQTYNANIRFEDIQFAYPSHPDVSILNEVSFTLSDGEMLAVVSASEVIIIVEPQGVTYCFFVRLTLLFCRPAHPGVGKVQL